MHELGHSECMFQIVKYYAESSWFIDNGIMTKPVYKCKRSHVFIGMLEMWIKNKQIIHGKTTTTYYLLYFIGIIVQQNYYTDRKEK
jgi:hypothetical protein